MNLSAQDHQTFFTCEADAGNIKAAVHCFQLGPFKKTLLGLFLGQNVIVSKFGYTAQKFVESKIPHMGDKESLNQCQ